MPNRDTVAQRVVQGAGRLTDDLASGFGLLSRLPVPTRAFTGALSVWVWPMVGAVIGLVAGLVGLAAAVAGLPPGVTAALVMAVGVILTGAMHEDGLADSADGLFGGWTPERRLEIMKDSRIGSYGMLALLLVGLARWATLSALIAAGPVWAALVAAGALSRAPMAVIMAVMPNARQGGLSAGTGRPPLPRALLACAIALGIAGAVSPQHALTFALAAILPALGMAVLAQRRIKGQTGDILGAAQHLSDTAVLIVASAMLS